MEKKIKWGVIGSGGIARRRTIPEGIIPSENAILVSVYDINKEVNDKVAEDFGAIPAGSIPELLDSGIDAVYIGSPVNKHLEHVILCARSRKHILCEKPLGLDYEEACKIAEICAEEKVTLGTAFMMRFHAQHQAALKMINEGKLGKPVYARAQLSCWYPPLADAWRQTPHTGGGGSLIDMGSHCIDLLEMFFGRVSRVSCFINNSVHGYKSEDSALVSLFFENGALGSVDTFFCIPDNSSKNQLELYGSKGSILAKGTIGQGSSGEMIAFLEDDFEGYNAAQNRILSEGQPIIPIPVNTYKAEIEEFSQALIESREPSNNSDAGLRNQQIVSACYESARLGQIIHIEQK
ncbi:MAG: Gfo/Idh/MocA family protein [Bacteroidales bacterium]